MGNSILLSSRPNTFTHFIGLFNLIPIVQQDFEDITYEYIWQTVQSNTFQPKYMYEIHQVINSPIHFALTHLHINFSISKHYLRLYF